uniref:dUTPase-like domain-containing protein n=1 Tax=Pipistrellus kuhlii TaxID=59472 RepID=A0A7J7SND7_PIPKU|nr:hypothetical protein mPipKuh1_009793 [Pipistrellus kuhlii]
MARQVPTGIWGPVPPGISPLVLEKSENMLKELTVFPEVIDSEYKGKIKVISECKHIMQIIAGQKKCSASAFFFFFLFIFYYMCTYLTIAPPTHFHKCPHTPEFCVHWLCLYACIQVFRLISYLNHLSLTIPL